MVLQKKSKLLNQYRHLYFHTTIWILSVSPIPKDPEVKKDCPIRTAHLHTADRKNHPTLRLI